MGRGTGRAARLVVPLLGAIALVGGTATAQTDESTTTTAAESPLPFPPGDESTTTTLADETGTGDPSAGSPEVFAAGALAQGFHLTVGGMAVAFGRAESAVESAPSAKARGVGQLTFDSGTPENAAEATADGQADDKPETCAAPVLPAEMTGIGAEVVCSSASAKVDGGFPSATSSGRVSEITLAANNILTQLPVTEPVRTALDQVLGALPPGVGMPVVDLIEDVIENETLSLTVGPTTSSASADADEVRATAGSQGAVIELFPTGALDGGPLVRIVVGDGSATATYDRAGGAAMGEFAGRVVTVTLAAELQATLRLPEREIVLSAVDTTCLPLPDPLTSCITIGGGEVTEDEEGVVTAFAAGVSLDLLKGLQGGIQIELAAAEATAGGTPEVEAAEVLAVVEETTTTLPLIPAGELPRTGGTPLLPIAGGVLLATAAVLGAVALAGRRERTAATS